MRFDVIGVMAFLLVLGGGGVALILGAAWNGRQGR